MPVALVRENLRENRKHKNRALDEVVSEASKHGIKIKPLHGASPTSDDIALIRKDKKPDKRFIGLGRKFYGFRNPEEEEEDLKEFSSLAKATVDDHTGPGGVISLRCSKSHFRLNPRTRRSDFSIILTD